MSDDAALHARLTNLARKTESAKALDPGGWWVGDVAGERRVRDDLAAGRLHWRAAHDNATCGLTALDRGDRNLAQACAWAACDFYIEALEIRLRIRPAEMDALGRSSKRRGRPRIIK